MSDDQIENFNHLPFAERVAILRSEPTTMTPLDKVAERLSLVRETLFEVTQTVPLAKIAYDHATEGLRELREHPADQLERLQIDGRHLLDMIDAQRRDLTPVPKRETNDEANSRDERDQVFGDAVERFRKALEKGGTKRESENQSEN